MRWIKIVGMASAVLMPFFDIPLMIRVIQRKSSEDISLIWVFGIEFCILGMFPSTWVSTDPILRAFGLVNAILFTAAFVAVVWFHPLFRKPKV
jgi:hypothetical protein